MEEQLIYWAVVKDGRGKWVVKYDPKGEIKGGKRFAFEVTAKEYQKKMIKKDAESVVAQGKQQRTFSPEGGEM